MKNRRCAFCDVELMRITIVRVTDDAEHPEPLELCQRCGFLPAEERQHLWDETRRRMSERLTG